jgi:Ion channel
VRTASGSTAVAKRRKAVRDWRERVREPSLTILLILDTALIFFALPLAARGWPIAQVVGDALVLAVLMIVVLLSDRRGAIILILLAMAAIAASPLFGAEWQPTAKILVKGGGNILAFGVLIWVVAHVVFAPGRITSRRLQGAVVVYLSVASIFAAAYGLIWELQPSAFANLPAAMGVTQETATMMYFSLTTLTTTGYGDVLPVDPFARSLANLEAVLGQLYVAITIARLVTLEITDRRRPPHT